MTLSAATVRLQALSMTVSMQIKYLAVVTTQESDGVETHCYVE